jgi:N-acetylmuramoyl-L-alanine amidase
VPGKAAAAGLTVLGAVGAALLGLGASRGGAISTAEEDGHALPGEARRGSLTVAIAPVLAELRVTEARVPGRPIVVIDPGHGGRDPGATTGEHAASEKALTLLLAQALRDRLAERGRVRVALTRETDRYLSLDQRAAIARHLGASLYLSLHIDSAANPLATGATVYSLSDVASDADAARLAARENEGGVSSQRDGSVRALLADLAAREQMAASAQLAERIVRRSRQRIALRPEPHRFADFHVLRSAGAPAVLFEAGYLSNVEEQQKLADPLHRAAIAAVLADAIEADVASRNVR